jgi:ADP-ribose pyrophosphatase
MVTDEDLPEAWRTVSGYEPEHVETPAFVRANDRTKTPGGWADPEVVPREELASRKTYANNGRVAFGADGLPLNPGGPTGKRGRLLGKWGPNHAADPLILRRDEDGALQMLAILRRSDEWAMPGGMVDEGEAPHAAATRELKEETDVDVDMSDGVKVYEGLAPADPRYTDNAWMEAVVFMKLLPDDLARALVPRAGDDA